MKRNLPSWMSSSNSSGSRDTEEKPPHRKTKPSSNDNSTDFSKLMDGVVFVLSGFVNPERSVLRSQALEMGAQYKADWDQDCTLLVCAFSNTPKFRQVQSDCGTIVSKGWISECYAQKKLVDIDSYLMHPGKPWKKQENSAEDQKAAPRKESHKVAESGSYLKQTTSASPPMKSKSKTSSPAKKHFSPSELKKWAIDDLNKTISWLESQDEKPEPSEMKNIAAEGILTCIQDSIDSLEQKQSIQKITEQWNFVPRVVEELAKLENTNKGLDSISVENLCKEAKSCKQIYEAELRKLHDISSEKGKKVKTAKGDKCENGGTKAVSSSAGEYDSDETVEMTEEEIDIAFRNVTSSVPK